MNASHPHSRLGVSKVKVGFLIGLLGLLGWMGKSPSRDEAMEEFMASHGIPGAVIAYGRAGDKPTIRAYGNLRPDVRLPIASLTKPITSAAVMELARNGRMRLDAPLADYIAEFHSAGDPRHRQITVRQALQHQGGWATDTSGIDGCTRLSLWLRTQPLDYAPGTRAIYSNAGYCWLGRAVENVGGIPYATVAHRLAGATMSTGPARIFGAAGGLEASAADLFRFYSTAPMDLGPTVEMSGVMTHYGLGWAEFPEGIGHVGRLAAPVDVLHVAFRALDGRVAVAMFNRHPERYAEACAQARKLLASL